MSYRNLQLQTLDIAINSTISGKTYPEISIGTRFTPTGQFTKLVNGTSTITELLDLGQNDQLRVFVRGLSFGDIITITDIRINNITLQHYIYQGRQYQPQVDNYYQPGTEFRLDGVYELDVTLPIWRWIMNHIEREISERSN